MPANLVEEQVWQAAVTVPVNGDLRNAASLYGASLSAASTTGFRSLTDRSDYLLALMMGTLNAPPNGQPPALAAFGTGAGSGPCRVQSALSAAGMASPTETPANSGDICFVPKLGYFFFLPSQMNTSDGDSVVNQTGGGDGQWISIDRAFGMLIAQNTSNEDALEVAGNGTGNGIVATGGATGQGVKGIGGATSGVGGQFAGNDASPTAPATLGTINDGVQGTGGATNSNGVAGIGAGTGAGVLGKGVGSGSGVKGIGGGTDSSAGVTGTTTATNGDGVAGTGTGTGAGVRGTAAGSSGNGVVGVGGAGVGVYGSATGSNPGVDGFNNSTGPAVLGVATGSGAAMKGDASGGTGPSGQFIPAGAGSATPLRGHLNLVPNTVSASGGSVLPSTASDGDVWVHNDSAGNYSMQIYLAGQWRHIIYAGNG